MGNYRPIKTFTPSGVERVLIRDNEEILRLLTEEWWIEQNIPKPKAIWMRHVSERDRPNLNYNTFMHLQEKSFIEEAGTLYPIARFAISKHGKQELERLVKVRETPPTPVVEEVKAAPVVEHLVPVVPSSPLPVSFHTWEEPGTGFFMLVRSTAKDKIDEVKALLNGALPVRQRIHRRPMVKNHTVICDFCGKSYGVTRFIKTVWKRHCDDCRGRYVQEYDLFRRVYGHNPKPGDK